MVRPVHTDFLNYPVSSNVPHQYFCTDQQTLTICGFRTCKVCELVKVTEHMRVNT